MKEEQPIDPQKINVLREAIRGRVITPRESEYAVARAIWNGRFDRQPAAIAFCADARDVRASVNFVRENGLPFSVRSGGHDYAGNSVCEGGLVIDLSTINTVTVDPASKTVRVGAGARWAAVDEATMEHGLVTPGGTVSTVGVAGFTLGGGTGWLSRRHGLALDNLLAAEVVLADGKHVRASVDENEDLFWALRGGSGNFGIVTFFTFRLHTACPQVLAGQVFYSLESARKVLRTFRDTMAEAPDELQCYPFFIRVPPLAAFPAEHHGKVALDLVLAYAGDATQGEQVVAPLRTAAQPFFDGVMLQNFLDLQRTFDDAMPPGNRWYSKTHYFRGLNDEAIEVLLQNVLNMPGPFTAVYMDSGGGAICRIDSKATAFPHRDAAFALHIFPGWADPTEDDAIIRWARSFHADMAPFSTGGAYVNLLGGDEPDGPQSAYGPNYERLAFLKRKYDPWNLFQNNQNIRPTAETEKSEP